MDGSTEREYKRKCFRGRGAAARWLDRLFFSALAGACLYILGRRLIIALALSGAAFVLFVLLGRRRWDRYRKKLLQSVVRELRREDWMKGEAQRLRQAGGVALFPAPDRDALVGLCLQQGPGTAFHCFGDGREDLFEAAAAFDCEMTFHPWQEGTMPTRKQVEERLRQKAPKRTPRLWGRLLRLPGNRYLMTGGLLLFLSMVLRKALYWRLLGSVCLLAGAVSRSFQRTGEM